MVRGESVAAGFRHRAPELNARKRNVQGVAPLNRRLHLIAQLHLELSRIPQELHKHICIQRDTGQFAARFRAARWAACSMLSSIFQESDA